MQVLDGNRSAKFSYLGGIMAVVLGLFPSRLYSFPLFPRPNEIPPIAVSFSLFLPPRNPPPIPVQ
jgi:hypothetical protein